MVRTFRDPEDAFTLRREGAVEHMIHSEMLYTLLYTERSAGV